MMENMIMDQVLGSPLLRKLQAMQSQPYQENHQHAVGNNYIGPNSSLSDIHIHDHLHHDAVLTKQAPYQTMGHTMLPPSSSPLPSQDVVVSYHLANSTFPYIICKKEEEEEEFMLVSSLPSCDALLGSRHSLLSTNDSHDFDSSYNTQLLQYASGGSSRYSSDLSSSYNTPLAEHVQCSIDPSPSSGLYTSQSSIAYTHLSSEDFSCLLKQSMKDEANCLGVDVQESNVKEVNKDAACSLMNANKPHLALSTSSSSTPTSMTSGPTCHANLQANWMAFDDNYHSNNPTSNYHSNDKLLHMNNMVNNGGHNGVSGASITSHEKKKKRKRKRTSHKNVQEMESQRMTHIAVERNRRKQMKEHLRVLRMLMPHSYIQRGDQASIVGGTTRFVEELQQVLQALQFQKKIRSHQEYKIMNAKFEGDLGACMAQMHKHVGSHVKEAYASTRSCMANVEVTMMTSSTIFVKVLAKKRPHHLLHTLLALSSLSLKVMDLNVAATELIIVYCFNLEMEDDCQLHTSNELAESIQHIFCM